MEHFAVFHNRDTGDIVVLANEEKINDVVDYMFETYVINNIITPVPIIHCSSSQIQRIKVNCLWDNPEKIIQACKENWISMNEKIGSEEFKIDELQWFTFALSNDIDEYEILKIK